MGEGNDLRAQGQQQYLPCCILTWPSLRGQSTPFPCPPFIIGAMNQARNRPVRLMGIQQGPHSPLPWLLQGQVMPLAYSVLDWGWES